MNDTQNIKNLKIINIQNITKYFDKKFFADVITLQWEGESMLISHYRARTED